MQQPAGAPTESSPKYIIAVLNATILYEQMFPTSHP